MEKEEILKFDKKMSYIVIGNGPSLLSKEVGEKIDEYDEVIRFNRYKIEGFEKHVGTKTTIWSTFGRGELPSDESSRPSKIIYVHGNVGNPSYKPQEIIRIPISYYNDLRKKLQKETKQKEGIERLIPSSGILVISWLLENYLEKITITGFDSFSKEASKKHHYWHPSIFGKPKEHDGEWERKIIQKFFKLTKLKFL